MNLNAKVYYYGEEPAVSLLEKAYGEYAAAAKEAGECDVSTGFVFGCGDVKSRVMLVGEAPGKDEIAEGRPFVGKAGSILDDFLSMSGIRRGELFITNTVKYRLARLAKNARTKTDFDGAQLSLPGFSAEQSHSAPAAGKLANRPAKEHEVRLGAGLLKKEIEIIKPEIVVTLGNVPLKAVTAAFFPDVKPLTVGNAHGEASELTEGTVLFPMYHPASLIYNPGNATVYAEDMKKLADIVKEL